MLERLCFGRALDCLGRRTTQEFDRLSSVAAAPVVVGQVGDVVLERARIDPFDRRTEFEMKHLSRAADSPLMTAWRTSSCEKAKRLPGLAAIETTRPARSACSIDSINFSDLFAARSISSVKDRPASAANPSISRVSALNRSRRPPDKELHTVAALPLPRP